MVTALLGPLAGIECRRALGRGWLIAVRMMAAIAIMGAALITVWYWWIHQFSTPGYLPFFELRGGLAIVEGMMITVALVLGPAVLAGSLAGDRERGALGLLLTTRVGAREIVLGRLAGKLAQVGMILLAGVPAVVLLAAMAGMPARVQLGLLALPAAVAVGGGGLSALASVVSRRGRDALLAVYLIDLLFLLSPLSSYLGVSLPALEWLAALSPFAALDDLIWGESLAIPGATIAAWLALGHVGAELAIWRLRPSTVGGGRGAARSARLRRRPPLDEERPMRWKELYIERASVLGGAGWWIGLILTVGLGVGVPALGLVAGLGGRLGLDQMTIDEARTTLTIAAGPPSTFLGWLIQWAIGLRAAVAIASERERGTWDAILTSPLEGRAIVRAKVYGSLHALRWLLAATVLAWTVAFACAAIPDEQYARWVVGTLVLSAFMAAVGVRASLWATTATRAMAMTIGAWLVSWVVVYILAAIVVAFVVFLALAAATLATAGDETTASALTPGMVGSILRVAWPISVYGLFAAATALLIADTRLRFDRIAGRMTGGRLEVAVDALVHGRPLEPIPRSAIVEVSEGAG